MDVLVNPMGNGKLRLIMVSDLDGPLTFKSLQLHVEDPDAGFRYGMGLEQS